MEQQLAFDPRVLMASLYVFALAAFLGYQIISRVPPLLHIFGVLLIALIGAPTPGAIMAVWLSQKMTASTFFRSSALAGILMFAAAFVLSALWSLLTAGHLLFLDQFKLSGQAFLVGLLTLSLLGALRGMLDVHIYWRLTRRQPE